MRKIFPFLAILLVAHLLLLTNIQFTAWPEMLSYPYLFSNGFKLYSDFVYPYPPLLTLLLAGFYKIFGFNILALKIVAWSFVLVSDVFLFLIAKKFLRKDSLAFFLLIPYLLLQTLLDGNMLWFDNALVLPVVGSLYYLINWNEKKKSRDLILAGIFLTAGIFVKQTAMIYFVIATAFILFSTRLHSMVAKLKSFLVIPFVSMILFSLYLLVSGSFKDFWLWSLYYPLSFWSKFPGYQDIVLSTQEKVVFGLTLLPFLAAFFVRRKHKVFLLILGFLAGSILAVYPRFTYFHLQPVFAISFIGFAVIMSYLKKNWYLFLVGVIAIISIYPMLNYSFVKSVRFYDEEDQKIIKMVSALSTKDEGVYLVGLFSSFYAFADRLPPKPWADNFGWYWEVPGEAGRILERFEENPPDKIFYKVPERGNWFDLGVYRPQKLLNYIYEHYYLDSEPIGGIELWRRKE